MVQGFGDAGVAEAHRFVVTIPRSVKDPVMVVEDYGAPGACEARGDRILRAVIERARWDEISDTVRTEFNRRLKLRKMPTGRWTSGDVPVDRLLGKELVLLAWAIEDAPADKTGVALANWLGLSQEQRWSLYTLTAAATGDALRHRGIGWRRAVMIAMTENPVSGPVGQVTKAAPRRRKKPQEDDRGSQSLFLRHARNLQATLAA
jgi:hypothetical protein